ncbi:MAG: ribosome biogenesis GTPase Der [Chloroflexi bacterium]|nr:ribosome biogenesis GTPase Der [Chloroflexota bacterium]
MPKPLVAIVGRPNVGKSTLFNRLVGERVAIVEDVPGTTRDRLYADTEWSLRAFTLIDTGGLELTPDADFSHLVRQQAELAIAEADVVVFLVNAKEGITADDLDIAEVLRRSTKPVLVAANKADSEERRLDVVQFYELGLGEVLPLSAIHGIGTGDLLDGIVQLLPPEVAVEERGAFVSIAIVGRPNVGKSSILNAILGRERVIVSEVPGTTRDAIDTMIDHEGNPVLLIDTAGIRRRGKIIPGIEKYSAMRALRAIDRADVVALVIDAVEGVTDQDTHIAGYAQQAFKGIELVVNKWDLIKKTDKTMIEYAHRIRGEFKFLNYAPILFVSAKTRQRLDQIADTALRIKAERGKRVPTGILNDAIRQAVLEHTPPSMKGRPLKIYYVTQTQTDPPTFVFFVNNPKLVHFSFERYLENRLREHFGFEGTAIKLIFRGRTEAEVRNQGRE